MNEEDTAKRLFNEVEKAKSGLHNYELHADGSIFFVEQVGGRTYRARYSGEVDLRKQVKASKGLLEELLLAGLDYQILYDVLLRGNVIPRVQLEVTFKPEAEAKRSAIFDNLRNLRAVYNRGTLGDEAQRKLKSLIDDLQQQHDEQFEKKHSINLEVGDRDDYFKGTMPEIRKQQIRLLFNAIREINDNAVLKVEYHKNDFYALIAELLNIFYHEDWTAKGIKDFITLRFKSYQTTS